MVNFGPRETVPPQFEGRNLYAVITMSLDRAVDDTAQNAVDGIAGKKAMIVAIKPSPVRMSWP